MKGHQVAHNSVCGLQSCALILTLMLQEHTILSKVTYRFHKTASKACGKAKQHARNPVTSNLEEKAKA